MAIPPWSEDTGFPCHNFMNELLSNCEYSGTVINARDIGGELPVECPYCGAVFRPQHLGGGYRYPVHPARMRIWNPKRFKLMDATWIVADNEEKKNA